MGSTVSVSVSPPSSEQTEPNKSIITKKSINVTPNKNKKNKKNMKKSDNNNDNDVNDDDFDHEPSPSPSKKNSHSKRRSLSSDIIARIRYLSIDHISDRISFRSGSMRSKDDDNDGCCGDDDGDYDYFLEGEGKGGKKNSKRKRNVKVKFASNAKKNDWIAFKHRAYLAIVCDCFLNDPSFNSHHTSHYKQELANSPLLNGGDGYGESPKRNSNR